MRRKMLITVVLIFTILLQCITPLMTVNASTSVKIDTLSSELYAAIKSSLDEQCYDATYDDTSKTITISSDVLSKVTYLDLSNSEIDDLTGLSNFTSVTELNLTANNLTVDSNLDELDSLPLEKLNLSSNQLESVSSISTFDSITYTDVTNQKVTKTEIITVDVSDDSNQATTATVTLPDILLSDGALDADWFSTEALTSSSTQATIDWNSASATSLTLTINVADDSGTFTALESGIKLTVDVDDATSSIANTEMTLYYIVVSSEQTGIIFYDSYLYNAVKEQLTAGQTVNSELESYTGTTLYEAAYDDALVLVIDNDVLLNKITSLILYDEKITDLKGLEEFIGLESDLNVSYNYIETIERILELEANKEAKEDELQSEYADLISILSSYSSSLKSAIEDYDAACEAYQNDASEENYEAVQKAYAVVQKYRTLLNKVLEKMYETYEKEYLLSTVLTSDTVILTESEINSATSEELMTYVEEICSRLISLEEEEALTDWEMNIITTIIGMDTSSDYPIKAYCEAIQEEINDELYTTAEAKEFLTNMRIVDTVITAGNYCIFEGLYGGNTSASLSDGLAAYEEDLEVLGYTTEFISDAETAINNNGFTAPSYDYTSDAEELEEIIGAKYSTVASDLIAIFIKLPRLKSLNITDNSIESIDGIEALSELETLIAYKNLLDDVSDVEWSALADTLTYLDLGYNQLSDIDCLEVLSNLEYLYVNKNLLSGSFGFTVTGMSNLQVADFSENQISDISSFINQFKFKAAAAGVSVEEYVLSYSPSVSFQYQTLSMSLTTTLESSFITVDLPKIFAQAESIDYSRTSFGLDSLSGTVSADGSTAKLYTPSTGTYKAVVYIEGYNGSGTYSTAGIAYGTACTITYSVVEETEENNTTNNNTNTTVTFTADTTDLSAGETTTLTYYYSGSSVDLNSDTVTYSILGNSSSSTKISGTGSISVDANTSEYSEVVYLTIGADETADTITVTAGFDADSETTRTLTFYVNSSNTTDVDVTYGYTVSDGYVYVTTPGISLSSFASNLVADSSETVTVTVANSADALNNYIATGAVVSIDTASGEEVAILEVVVLGDVNGDGEVDALDSGLVRAVINDTKELVGVYYSAADVNQDGDIDSLDALKILQYRADKITSF